MPELGRYKKVPRPESIETLRRYLGTNPTINRIELVGPQLLLVQRKEGPDLKVFPTNIYIVGEADIYEILAEHSDLNAIVTMSGWNSYTKQAEELCKKRGIGLFKFKEFLGAVYYTDNTVLDYVSPEDREREASN